MPDLPKKKVGIVACSGEELAEGTIARLAALRVLEELRPDSTVTICLPLFLAGGEGDRAFARFYPTIAIDGCEKRCAAVATERYSGNPAAEFVVSAIVADRGFEPVAGRRRLNEPGLSAVTLVAEQAAEKVDDLLGVRWDRRAGRAADVPAAASVPSVEGAVCSCGSGIPTQDLQVEGETVTVAALPLLLDQFRLSGRLPGPDSARDLLREVRVYNRLPSHSEESYLRALELAFSTFLLDRG